MKNDSNSFEQEYEEYEVYEDRFDPAQREKPGTWDGEVQFLFNKLTKKTEANMDFLFIPVRDAQSTGSLGPS